MSEARTVVITANIFPGMDTEREVLAPLNVELVKHPCRNGEELAEAGKEAVALLVGNVRIDAEVLSHLPRCLAIVKPAVGVDNIDLEAATAAGVCVANVPDYGTDEVATHAMALLLNAIRYVDAEAAAVRGGRWQPKPPYPIQRSEGRTLGIIGFGRIGQSVARKAAGFDWRLLAWDPYLDDDEIRRGNAEPADFETLLAQSDFVTLHLPLTEETQGMIDASALAMMKPTAFLVNTARGGIVDSAALLQAVESGQIAGAAVDVVDEEPPPPDHPLYCTDRILVTAHVAWYSEQAFRDVRVKAVQEVARVLQGELPRNLLNPEVQPRYALRSAE